MSDSEYIQRWEKANERKQAAEKAYREECAQILTDMEAAGVEPDFALETILGRHVEFLRPPFTVHKLEVKSSESGFCPTSQDRVGMFVAVRPCGDEYEGETYLGIYLGDMYRGINAGFYRDSGLLSVRSSFANPAMYVPDLRKVIFGAGSWWSEIKSPEDLKKITNEDIDNVWYVRVMKSLSER